MPRSKPQSPVSVDTAPYDPPKAPALSKRPQAPRYRPAQYRHAAKIPEIMQDIKKAMDTYAFFYLREKGQKDAVYFVPYTYYDIFRREEMCTFSRHDDFNSLLNEAAETDPEDYRNLLDSIEAILDLYGRLRDPNETRKRGGVGKITDPDSVKKFFGMDGVYPLSLTTEIPDDFEWHLSPLPAVFPTRFDEFIEEYKKSAKEERNNGDTSSADE